MRSAASHLSYGTTWLFVFMMRRLSASDPSLPMTVGGTSVPRGRAADPTEPSAGPAYAASEDVTRGGRRVVRNGGGHVEPPMTVMAFIDAGYLIAAARRVRRTDGRLLIDGDELWSWAEHTWVARQGSHLVRAYVYDAAFSPEHPGFAEQRLYFDDLASRTMIRLRLGHLAERGAGTGRSRFEQKGVDTLMVLDLVRMAQQRAFDAALIVAGDRDFAEALRVVADDYSRRVVVMGVEGSEPHKELVHVSDDYGVLGGHWLSRLVRTPEELAETRAMRTATT